MLSKPRIPVKLPFTIAAMMALTACTGVTVSRVDHANQYDPLEATAAGGGDRQMRIVVLGNPFDIPQAQLEKAVVDALAANSFGVPINFAIDPENPDPSRPYRLVMAFNPDGLRDPGNLCKAVDDLEIDNNAGDKLTLMGAFCSTDLYLSHAIVRAGDVTGPRSETFDDMIFQLKTALFPGRNPNEQTLDAPPIPGT